MIIRDFDLNERRMLIAEIGNNHEGDPVLAKELISAAIDADADAIKMQIIDPEHLINCAQTERISQLSRFRLSPATISSLAQLVRSHGKLFMASVFDIGTLNEVHSLLDAIKIASGDIDFIPLLIYSSLLGKPIILSTGASSITEIQTAVDAIRENLPAKNLTDCLALLHCVSMYPTPLSLIHLEAIPEIGRHFKLTTGFSDHTLGTEAAVLSLSLGARIIEKHFTIDKTRTTFRDHALSIEPDEMRRLSWAVHNFDGALCGKETQKYSTLQQKADPAIRRSIVAAHDLPAGTQLQECDLDFVRPQNGLPPSEFKRLIGKTLKVKLNKHDLVLDIHL